MANKKTPAKAKQTTQKEPVGEYRCSCCGVIYNKRQGNYFKSGSPLYAGNEQYIHVCKNCTNEYYKKLLGFYNGDAEKAIRRCCEIFDVYYNDSVFAASGKEATDSRIATFLSKLNMVQFKSTGKNFLDTIEEEKDKPRLEITETDDDTGSYTAPPEVVLAWGNDYSNEEYFYLQTEFDDYKARYDIATKAHEELVRTICVVQLGIRKTQDVGERTKMMKTLQDLIRTADLKPNRAADEAALSAENSFGMLIKKLENEKPVRQPSPEWQDVDDISSYIDTYFLSHICKLTKRQIPNEDEYVEEMEKYTVKPPTYEDGE